MFVNAVIVTSSPVPEKWFRVRRLVLTRANRGHRSKRPDWFFRRDPRVKRVEKYRG
jgi:hypothetical protein